MRLQSSLSAVLFAGMFASSCGNQAETHEAGHANVSISAMTSSQAITSITIEAQPANIIRDLAYNKTAATFSGSLMLPAGTQTLTARAYVDTQAVGQGAATVTIVAGQTASVFLKILDTSAPTPMPDSSPGIVALVLSTTRPTVGQPVTMSVSAADPNGDPLSYAWTSNCTSGSFSTTSSADTTWTNTAVGVCTVTATVTAKGKSASQQVDIVTLDVASGVATVEGSYVSAPIISHTTASGSGFSCSRYHSDSDATCLQSLSPGQVIQIASYFTFGEPPSADGGTGSIDVTLTDNCGGPMLHLNASTLSMGNSAHTSWTAPSTPAVCVLTLTVTQETMVDRLSFAVVVR